MLKNHRVWEARANLVINKAIVSIWKFYFSIEELNLWLCPGSLSVAWVISRRRLFVPQGIEPGIAMDWPVFPGHGSQMGRVHCNVDVTPR
jgi:hypothetical protein